MAVLFDGDGRVLLIRQNYGRRLWALPGGSLEPGESAAAAAVREVREEIGVDVALDGLVAVYHLRPPRPGIRFVFGVAACAGTPHVAAPDEVAEIGWFAADGLPEAEAGTLSVPYAIADAVAGRRGVFRELDR